MADIRRGCPCQVPSDQNIPFNEKPEMKSAEITKLGIDALKSGKYNQVGDLEQVSDDSKRQVSLPGCRSFVLLEFVDKTCQNSMLGPGRCPQCMQCCSRNGSSRHTGLVNVEGWGGTGSDESQRAWHPLDMWQGA